MSNSCGSSFANPPSHGVLCRAGATEDRCANRIGFVEHNTFDPSRLGVEPRQDETRASTELGRMSGATDRRNTQTEVSAGDFSLDKAERELIARALQESGWQKTRAAALLGITRATLYAKVKQHNIQRGTYLPKAAQDDQLSPSRLDSASSRGRMEQETVTAA